MPAIRRYVLSKLHNPKNTAHAPSARVQAAFLYAWRSRAAFRFEQGNFVAWPHGIARRHCIHDLYTEHHRTSLHSRRWPSSLAHRPQRPTVSSTNSSCTTTCVPFAQRSGRMLALAYLHDLPHRLHRQIDAGTEHLCAPSGATSDEF
ncbi:RNA polymerase sigma factor [Streptomyces coelicoflavus]|uniref:hypothetical protein n=1 Tax=Streptomyces coelicoflavus TaxID=285562 RepID=UPI003684F406